MTAVVKNIIIIGGSVIMAFFIINSIIQTKNNNKIIKELTKIENYNLREEKYIETINTLKNNLMGKDSSIAVLQEKNTTLAYSILKLEKIKTIKKDGTFIEIKNINNYTINELDSFFTNRFK